MKCCWSHPHPLTAQIHRRRICERLLLVHPSSSAFSISAVVTMRASSIALLLASPAVASAFAMPGGGATSAARGATATRRARGSVTKMSATADDTAKGQSEFDNVVMKTYGRYPITMAGGKGAHLWDSTGKEVSVCVVGSPPPP